MQKSASSSLQNQQPSLQQPTQSMLQQQPQSVLGQQQHQSQQPSVMHQPRTSMSQHPMLPAQQLSGQQPNPVNVQQNPTISQQTEIDQQKQLLQLERGAAEGPQTYLDSLPQTGNVSGVDCQEEIYQKIKSMNELYCPELDEMYQRMAAKLQQHDALLEQSRNEQYDKLRFYKVMLERIILFLQTNKNEIQPIHKDKILGVQKQIHNILSSKRPQKQVSALQQGQISQSNMHPMPQSRPMQQQLMFQQQITIDQQKQLLQSERGAPEGPQISLDSLPQTGNVTGADWQEEIYQKIKSMNELYCPELGEMYQRMAAKLQQHDALPEQSRNEQHNKLRFYKVMLEHIIMFLQTNKNEIQPIHKDKIVGVQKQIHNILSSKRPQNHVSALQQGQISQSNMHPMPQSRPMQQQLMFQQQTTIDQQKQLLQSERGTPEGPQTSSVSLLQTGNVSGADWQEEIYQKIKSMNELYCPELDEMYQRMAAKLQQHDALLEQSRNEHDKLRFYKVMLERIIMFLQTNKNEIQPIQKDQIARVEKQIHNILSSMRPQKHVSALQQEQISQSNMLPMPQSRPMQQQMMFQQQTTIDQQKQLLQSERGAPEGPQTSSDSSSQTRDVSGADWQEEIYQKIKSMNQLYFPELNAFYQRVSAKLQQHDALPQQPKNEQLEKLRFPKVILERLVMFLQTNKNEIQPNHKDKIAGVQKSIHHILSSNRPQKHISALQHRQISQPNMHPMQQSQLQQSQMHMNDGQMNSQMQPANVQSSVVTAQHNTLTNVQHSSLSSVSSVSNSRQNMMDVLRPGSNIESGQCIALNQMHQVAMSSLQQNPVNSAQQMNISLMSSQGGLTTLPSNVNPLQSNSNMLQPQQIKQEQQMFSAEQQIKQEQQMFSAEQMNEHYQQQQMNPQFIHKQQLIQQNSQQQSSQLPTQQMQQLNQMDSNDMKIRLYLSVKSEVIEQHNSSGQRSTYHHQQIKPGAPFSNSSKQGLQATSPQIGHHSSPQIDQQNLLSSHAKAGTPLQSASSPFVVPSPSTSMAPSPMPGDSEKANYVVSSLSNTGNFVHPSTSMAPSPMPGDSEKANYGVSSLSNTGNFVHPSTTATSMPNQSLTVGTSGISASPLLAEITSPDGTHGVASTIVSGNSNVVEQPLERLTNESG